MKNHICENCNFSTNNSIMFERHKKTQKHQKYLTVPIELKYNCDICDRKYKTNVGLWKHKKKCTHPANIVISYEDHIETIKGIAEIKNIMIEMKENQQPGQIINHNIDTQNNFNVNVFLNENVRPSIGFVEMLSNIKIDNSYRKNIEENGYANTLGDLIKLAIDEIPVKERPIHCIKNEIEHQEVIHIRDNDEWKKEMELEWTKEIYDFYNGDIELEDVDKKRIFYGLVKMEEQLFEQMKDRFSKSFQFWRFERDAKGELNFIPNKMKIIDSLLQHIKVGKTEFKDIMEDFMKEDSQKN